MSSNIKVCIRVRSLISREKDEKLKEQWKINENCMYPFDVTSGKRNGDIYYFDHIFDSSYCNADIYSTIVHPVVDKAMNGFNGTIFAYGQTSSGKTYTMMGDANEDGLISLAVQNIFLAIEQSVNRKFLLRVSYMEIYNEKIYDLLDTKNTVKISADYNGSVIVKVKEEVTDTAEKVYDIMKKGDKARRIGVTNMNEKSSRSHTIFRIIIETSDISDRSVAHLNLVDLAGSERATLAKTAGQRLKEGAHINKSLSTLSLVMKQLSESQDFINFRDSKLTRILQPSLGGNALTAIICAVTPAALEETHSTLAFASRAKTVKNKPKKKALPFDEYRLTSHSSEKKSSAPCTSPRSEDVVKSLIHSATETPKSVLRERAEYYEQEFNSFKELTSREKIILMTDHTAEMEILQAELIHIKSELERDRIVKREQETKFLDEKKMLELKLDELSKILQKKDNDQQKREKELLDSLQEAREQLKSNKDTNLTEMQKATDKLQENMNYIENLQKEIGSVQNNNTDLTKEIAELKKKNEKYKKIFAEVTERANSKIMIYHDIGTKLKRDNDFRKMQIRALEEKNIKTLNQLIVVQEELKKKDNSYEIDKFQTKINNLEEKNKKLVEIIKHYPEPLYMKGNEFNAMKKTVETLKYENSEWHKIKRNLNDKLYETEVPLKSARSNVQLLGKENEHNNNVLKNKREQLKKSKRQRLHGSSRSLSSVEQLNINNENQQLKLPFFECYKSDKTKSNEQKCK